MTAIFVVCPLAFSPLLRQSETKSNNLPYVPEVPC